MNIAIIPARGGSKRIPKKNIKQFLGKPMISYPISIALSTGIFEKVIVSTDDNEIADIAQAAGAEVPFIRPTDLSDDFTPTVPVIKHAVEFLIKEMSHPPQFVCCIYPANPFLREKDLENALDLLKNTRGVNYSFPICEYQSPIQRALQLNSENTIKPFNPEYALTRTQDLPKAFFDAGQFYWGKQSTWLSEKELHTNSTGLVIPNYRTVDIDTKEDWERAEILYKMLRIRDQ